MTFGGGNGLGKVTCDDRTCEARDVNPSSPDGFKESGVGGGTETSVVVRYESGVTNVANG